MKLHAYKDIPITLHTSLLALIKCIFEVKTSLHFLISPHPLNKIQFYSIVRLFRLK